MVENNIDTQHNDEAKLLAQIGEYNSLVLLYKLYLTRKKWSNPQDREGADQARELINSLPTKQAPETEHIREPSYSYLERATALMEFSIANILPTIFSAEQVEHARRYTGPECVQITFGTESAYKTHKTVPYWEMEPSQRKPMELGRESIHKCAEEMKTAMPEGVKDRLKDTDYLDLSTLRLSSHEYSHAIDETIEVDSQHGKATASTFERAKTLDGKRFLAMQGTYWEKFLHRELFARGAEVAAVEFYLKNVFQLTDEEYSQFSDRYYGERFKQARALRALFEYLKQNDPAFNFEELQLLKTSIKNRLRMDANLPDVAFFLPYKEQPYDKEMMKKLAGGEPS